MQRRAMLQRPLLPLPRCLRLLVLVLKLPCLAPCCPCPCRRLRNELRHQRLLLLLHHPKRLRVRRCPRLQLLDALLLLATLPPQPRHLRLQLIQQVILQLQRPPHRLHELLRGRPGGGSVCSLAPWPTPSTPASSCCCCR